MSLSKRILRQQQMIKQQPYGEIETTEDIIPEYDKGSKRMSVAY